MKITIIIIITISDIVVNFDYTGKYSGIGTYVTQLLELNNIFSRPGCGLPLVGLNHACFANENFQKVFSFLGTNILKLDIFISTIILIMLSPFFFSTN